ncbi:hypothetical protein MNBD_GAMMA04-1364 [hydrothermal vent metagenome]|uniref:DUF4276 family protein n=1 Tax=hydrothermal vent metagenome TaxID=652676 RepID=A0A3B0X0A1_9ZZZZ
MTTIVFFLEEPSAKEMLKGVLPKILSKNTIANVLYIVFEGKQDLEKHLPIKLRAWLDPNAIFIVMRDQDSGDCRQIKQNLVNKCTDAGKPKTLVRIACHELESFYLGDLKAVSEAIGPPKIASWQNKSKFRNPDALANPSEELKKLAPSYQKILGSRAISPLLDIDNNKSTSFNALIKGIQSMLSSLPQPN